MPVCSVLRPGRNILTFLLIPEEIGEPLRIGLVPLADDCVAAILDARHLRFLWRIGVVDGCRAVEQ